MSARTSTADTSNINVLAIQIFIRNNKDIFFHGICDIMGLHTCGFREFS